MCIRDRFKGLMDIHLSQHAHRGALLKEEPKCRYAAAKWFVAEFGAMGARKKVWDAEEAARKALLAIEESEMSTVMSVSYTHLTLPTKRIVEISVGAVSFKKKKETG
eukprot:TRINITY_DN16199_c0_g1_i2.p1 TRINITY_DN16199_c0_g1~~TRINITY_DN16199_c0_g1_i2.p1  ORF type:complete len:107 (-),score=15.84 TRINITY_DN16199_c0_g1_i2:68-388(-)